MDFGAVLEQYGILGVALFASGFFNWRQWLRNNEIQEARLLENRESTKEVVTLAHQVTAVASESKEAMRDLTRVVEDGIRNG